MFEHFTEQSRRVIFYSRYECASFGASALAPEHILLGLLREDKKLAKLLGNDALDVESIRSQVAANTPRNAVPTSPIDPPLTEATKRALALAAKESELLGDNCIDTAHLLLGLLAENDSLAVRMLNSQGITLTGLRQHTTN
jgi:ATP-dependent Clp protease ATP-binding subunit ClpC